MDMFEQAFAAAAEVSSDENWTRLQKYEEKEYYSATDVEINLDERTIGDLSGNVSTIGEDNSQYIQFIMDRYADGVDLTNMLIQIQYRLENGQESVSGPVNVYASESRIKFGWPISRIATQKEQTIQFIVYCTGNREDGEPYMLKTKPINYKIEFTLNNGGTIIAPDEGWFLQFENVMNEKLNQVAGLTEDAIDSAAGAKESEQNAAQSASTASTLAGQVQSNTAQAKASADAAKVSEQNAKASEDAARVYAGNASAVANVQIGTSDVAGLLRGGDIHVDESGALMMITETSEITMPNSYEGRLKFDVIEGKSEQGSTSGANLIDIDYTITGYQLPIPLEAGTYTLSFKTTASTGGFRLSNSTDTSTNSAVMTGGASNGYVVLSLTTNFVSNYINISSDSGTISEVMLNAGATALPYEPYTGGQPSPNPDYPQEIKTWKGKNELDTRGLSDWVYNSATFTPVYDGSGNLECVEVNGTPSVTTIYKVGKMLLKKGVSYILNGSPAGGVSAGSLDIRSVASSSTILASDYGTGVTYSSPTEQEVDVYIRIASGYTATNLRFYPMIRKASIADDTYVPYGMLRVWTHGKNFVKNTAKTVTSNGVTFTVYNDGSVLVNGTATANAILVLDNMIKNRLKIGDTYRLLGCPQGGATTTYRLDCVRPGVTSYMIDGGSGSSRYTVAEDTINPTVRIWIASGITASNLLFKPMVCNVNVEDVTYEPYKESSAILSPIDLYGIGDLQDVIEEGKVKRKFASVVFDGSYDEGWRIDSKGRAVISISDNPYTITDESLLLCSHYLGSYLSSVTNYFFIYEGALYFNVETEIGNITSWKEWLVANPITVVYPLYEHTTEELPIADQVALNSLATYDGITYLEFDSEIEPTFKGEYGTSKVGGYTLESLLTARNADLKVTAAQAVEE